MTENWIHKQEREAAESLGRLMEKRLAEYRDDIDIDVFDPWEAFPALYGSYSGDFDKCAIEVLEELLRCEPVRSDLGAYMFREMLCVAELCDYGRSPRVCFPTEEFAKLLPKLIEMWKAYSLTHWGVDVCEGEEG